MNLYSKEVDDFRKEADDLHATMHRTIQNNAVAFWRVREELGRFRKLGDGQCYVGLGFHPGSLSGVIAQIHLDQSESFKTLQPFFDVLVNDYGYEISGTSDWAEMGCRTYELKWKDARINVRVWIPEGSQHCKKVQDGMEPKYKFVCEGT